MAYKDKEKQRQANKEASARHRAKAKGMTEGMTNEGMTVTPSVIPNQPDCQCMHCRQARANNVTFSRNHVINHGPYKTAGQLAKGESNRVALPGDPDYDGVADQHPEWPRIGVA